MRTSLSLRSAATALAAALGAAMILGTTVPAANALAPVPGAVLTTNVPSGTDLWTTAWRLDLRSGPLGTYPVTVTARKDTRVRATGKEANGWLEVRIGGMYAWTPAKFLSTSEPAWNPTRVGVTAWELGLRSGPLGSYPVVVTAKRGTMGIISGVERNGWWQVKVNGVWSWTPAKFLSVGGYFDPNRILEVAHSQVGYREPSWRDNKYNDWIGGNNAWCNVFTAWVFAHAGYPGGVPKVDNYDGYVAKLRAAGVLDTDVTASDLQKGDVVLIDWVPRNGPTHTGIVDHVSGDHVWLVEGNTTSGTGDSTRGVFYRKRAIVDMHAVYNPMDYAAATS